MLGEKIKELRKLSGKKQKELADYLGFTEGQISHIESGNRKVSPDVLKKITKFFEVSEDYFFPGIKKTYLEDEIVEDFKKYALNKLKSNPTH